MLQVVAQGGNQEREPFLVRHPLQHAALEAEAVERLCYIDSVVPVVVRVVGHEPPYALDQLDYGRATNSKSGAEFHLQVRQMSFSEDADFFPDRK